MVILQHRRVIVHQGQFGIWGQQYRKVTEGTTAALRWDLNHTVSQLTGVDEELIGNSRVIHVMDGTGKQGGEDLQISEHGLDEKTRRHGKVTYCSGWIITLDCFDHLPPEQVWTVGRGWTGPRLQHGCCCGRPRLHGNGPPKSSWRWWKYPLVSWRTSAAHAPTATDPSLIMTDYCFVRLSDQVIQQKYPSCDDTWKMVYMVTVSGRLPEYSAILKMSIPHLLTSSISCQRATQMHGCTREI